MVNKPKFSGQHGQGLVEYGLIIGAIAIIVVGSFIVVGVNTKKIYEADRPMESFAEAAVQSKYQFAANMPGKAGARYFASQLDGYHRHGTWSESPTSIGLDVAIEGKTAWYTTSWTSKIDNVHVSLYQMGCSSYNSYVHHDEGFLEGGDCP